MKIEITVPEITLNTVIAQTLSYDAEDGEQYATGETTVGKQVAEIIAREAMAHPDYQTLRSKVSEIRAEEIRAAVRPIIAEALAGPIRKTNTYGEPTGSTTTLREMIMEEAEKLWTARTSDRYSSDRTPNIRDMVAAEVRKQIGSEISKAVREAHKAALDAIGKVAAQPVVDAVAKALKG